MREGRIPIHWRDHQGNATDDRTSASPCMQFTISNLDDEAAHSLTVWLLVDTGADMAQIASAVLAALNCKPSRHGAMSSNHGTATQPIYNVGFLAHGSGVTMEGEASECYISLEDWPYAGLIGRHFLQYGRLVLDGPQGESAFYYRFPV